MACSWTTGIGAAARVPLATHAAFSDCLLHLGTLARHAPADTLVGDALRVWRDLVPFDAAWWGEVAPDPPRNVQHGSIGLAATFAQEWNDLLAPCDTFAHGSMDQPGTVYRASGGYPGPPGIVKDFIDRHGLHAIMAVTLALPGSGLQFFVALYRADPHGGFTDTESALFAEYARHVVQRWEHRLCDLRATAPLDAFALSDRAGRLCYVGNRIAALLLADGKDWTGTLLPPALTVALREAPCCLRFGGTRLALAPVGTLVALTLGSAAPRLAPRELTAAMLFAQGLSYKEIARELALSPATVRTYLKAAYAGLGVTNRVELIAALAAGSSGR